MDSAQIRHDIKSPLAGLKALAQMALRYLEKGEQVKAKQVLKRLDGRLDEVVSLVDRLIP
jgi:C4-dicarboxylate-specific signal transduction histidine kinase